MILTILKEPDERLRCVAEPILQISNVIEVMASNMLETMYANNGIGLAAPQINQNLRLIVIDVTEESNNPVILINPEIVSGDGSTKSMEGCLSIDGKNGVVERYETVSVRCLNMRGEVIEFRCSGILSVCIQHEIDHLDGVLFTDRLNN